MAQEVEKKRMFDVPGLPRGWKRTEVIRKSGVFSSLSSKTKRNDDLFALWRIPSKKRNCCQFGHLFFQCLGSRKVEWTCSTCLPTAGNSVRNPNSLVISATKWIWATLIFAREKRPSLRLENECDTTSASTYPSAKQPRYSSRWVVKMND